MKPLSKSDYVLGLQCPGHLWLKRHHPEKIPPDTPGLQRRFDQGKIIGQYAKKLFPQGIDIPEDDIENLDKTKKLLSKGKILFEAGIGIDNVYARADILMPVGKEWDIIEVKSSSTLKKKHSWDLSFQRYVYEKSGLKIRKCFLMHLNNEYVRKGEIDVNELFKKEDLTKEVDKLMAEVPKNIKFLMEIIDSPTFPNTAEKNYCTLPKECTVKDECWNFLPEHHVFHLYSGRKNRELFEEGIHHLADVPEERLSNNQQKIQLKCAKTGKVHIDKAKIKEFLAKLEKVQCHLDFETCSFAVPEFNGIRPHQRLTFQFSLHVVPGKHFEYLYDGKDDPRPGFLAALKKMLPLKGSVVVYSQGFEGSVLQELAKDFPAYKEWVDSVLLRMVDLRVPFSNFWYYNPIQKGSASIKKVLPAITGKDYSGLEIQDGECASLAYLDLNFGSLNASEKAKIRKDLLDYCCLDTEAMVWMVGRMKELIH